MFQIGPLSEVGLKCCILIGISFYRSCTRPLLLDTTKMQGAIQSGKMEPVETLLKGMTDSQKKAQLCATYGDPVSTHHVRTSPMLHAVQCGNSGAFSALLRAARGLLKPQVGWSFMSTGPVGIRLLYLTVGSSVWVANDASPEQPFYLR